MPIVKNINTSVNSNAPCFSDYAPLPSENEDNTDLQIRIIGFVLRRHSRVVGKAWCAGIHASMKILSNGHASCDKQVTNKNN